MNRAQFFMLSLPLLLLTGCMGTFKSNSFTLTHSTDSSSFSQPGPQPVSFPPTLESGFTELVNAKNLAAGEMINYGGMPFQAQTKNILFDGTSLRFKASTGEFAYFDPADGRKIRDEVCSLSRMDEGKLYTFEMDIFASGPKIPHTDLQWWAPIQIHAADTRDANGIPLPASPIFAMDLQPNATKDGYDIKVTAQSHTNMNGGFIAERLLAKVPFAMDAKHHLKIEIVDAHGKSTGMVRVTLDNKVIVDQMNIATGYAFVDTDILYGGKPQPTGSYLKLGIYAGNQFRPADVTLQTQVSNFSWSVK